MLAETIDNVTTQREFFWLKEIAYQLAVMNERETKLHETGLQVVLCASKDLIPVRIFE